MVEFVNDGFQFLGERQLDKPRHIEIEEIEKLHAVGGIEATL